MRVLLSETTPVPALVPFVVELTDLTDKVEYIEGLTLLIVYARNDRFVSIFLRALVLEILCTFLIVFLLKCSRCIEVFIP